MTSSTTDAATETIWPLYAYYWVPVTRWHKTPRRFDELPVTAEGRASAFSFRRFHSIRRRHGTLAFLDVMMFARSIRQRSGKPFRHADSGLVVVLVIESVDPIFPSDAEAICIEAHAPCPCDGAVHIAMKLRVDWQSPNAYDKGAAVIGGGNIEVARCFRGLGIGSLALATAVDWLKRLESVPLSQIILAGEDAAPENVERRRRLYERIGIRFQWEEASVQGRGERMETHNLIVPADLKWRLADESMIPAWVYGSVPESCACEERSQ